MNGYLGKLLRVNLTDSKVKDYPLDPELTKKFIGGAGLACRILYDMVDKGTDPLSPENPLMIMTGPLTGTSIPTAGRTEICAKSPLTNIWGETACGGTFAAELRYAGYDGILIEGQAPKLVYLLIKDGSAEIRDASNLKGKDTFETQKLIEKEVGEENIKVQCIGPAGENLVRFAAVVHPDPVRVSVAGRTGMGAVMGSKRLKAVAVLGTKKDIPLAEPEKLKEVAKEIAKTTMENFGSQMFQTLGTAGYVDFANATGDLSTKYYTAPDFPGAYNISGSTMKEKILVKNVGCYRCPIRCGREVEIKEGKYKLPLSPGPEYETCASLGSNLMIDNLEAMTYLGVLCDRLGMDTISGGVTMAFAMYLYEKGVIGKEETGLELKWGDADAVIELFKKTATREGFGDILAEGTRRIGEKLEISPDEIACVNGLEIPFHDVRAYFGMAVAYATSPRGACHDQSDVFLATIGNSGPMMYPFGAEATDRFQNEGKGKTAAIIQDIRQVYNSLIMCIFVNPSPDLVINALNYATGSNHDIDSIKQTGERILNMKRLFNLKMGLTVKDETIPKIVLKPLEGGTEGNVPDLQLQLKEYYAFRKWDPTTGKPTKEKLEELGLGEFVKDL